MSEDESGEQPMPVPMTPSPCHHLMFLFIQGSSILPGEGTTCRTRCAARPAACRIPA